MTKNERKYAHLRAEGHPPEEAYAMAFGCNDKNYAAQQSAKIERERELAALVDQYDEATNCSAADIRREVVAFHLDTLRDDEIPVCSRQQAANSLSRLFALDAQRVEVSPDDALRRLLLQSVTASQNGR
ncbi:MAG: hypothetical protein LUE08_07335 [Akkermansiaceae bacterium]|nr:hypothetical protein [Akkermansiaceae bacterium]